MKKYNFILLMSFFIGFLSCENVDFGDTNDNPNGALKGDSASLMSGAISSYATFGGRDYLIKPTLYVQWLSQVTYTNEMRYAQTESSWTGYYVTIMNNLQEVINANTNEATRTAELLNQGAYENQIGVAQIFKAIVMKRVTDTWGPAPYSEAFTGVENYLPAYDSQEEIYKTLIEELKEARDMIDTGKKAPIGDILYKGDLDNWKRLANSVIMQMSLQMSKKYPSSSGYAATEFKMALEDSNGYISDIHQEAWLEYYDVTGFRNPWSQGRARDYFLSKELTDALKGNDALNPTSNRTYDQRLTVYGKNDSDGVPYGYRNKPSNSGNNQMNTTHYWESKASLPVMTASYTTLNRAEAAARGWTSENPEILLEQGIIQSYKSIDNQKGTEISNYAEDYATERLEDANSVGMQTVIGEEKWVTLFPSGFDAWAEWRRTSIPDLEPATDFLNNGTIPMRYTYPEEESNANKSNYLEALELLTPSEDLNSSKFWWEL